MTTFSVEVDPNELSAQIEQINNTIVGIRKKQRNKTILMLVNAACIMLNLSTIVPAVGILITFSIVLCSFLLGHFFSTIAELEESITTLANVVKMLGVEKKGEPVTDGKQTGI
jgi:hypothetical protein